tara:strand:+ start:388 stop:912 length:525 start_codon:yes stop_codon:yes gene_type:complete
MGEAQDLTSVIKSIYILKNQKILWNFIGTGSQFNKIKNELKKLKIQKKVKFYGKVNSYKASKLLRQADLLLITLAKKKIFSYTIPGKLQNYLGLGKPIVGMIDGEANKLINKNNLGLACKASDYQQLSKNILKIISMSQKQKKLMSKNSLNYVNKNFLKKKLLDQLRNEYFKKN